MTNRQHLKLLYGAGEIRTRVRALGREIAAMYPNREEELLCVCVLRGAAVFFSDLVRCIERDALLLDFMTLSSYGAGRTGGEQLQLIHGLNERIEGRHVLIVEDIVDSGRTVKFLRGFFANQNALSVRVAALLDKPARRTEAAYADFTAFTLDGDPFVVGYGLDDAQYWRQLDGVYVVK